MKEEEPTLDKNYLIRIWVSAIISTAFFGGIGLLVMSESGTAVIALLWIPAVVWVMAIAGSISYLVTGIKSCPNCGKRMDNSIKFCKKCGVEVFTNCPYCKAKLKSKASFCQACGKTLPELKPQEKKEPEPTSSPRHQIIERPIFCTYCGTQIEPNLDVCPACGESFK